MVLERRHWYTDTTTNIFMTAFDYTEEIENHKRRQNVKIVLFKAIETEKSVQFVLFSNLFWFLNYCFLNFI